MDVLVARESDDRDRVEPGDRDRDSLVAPEALVRQEHEPKRSRDRDGDAQRDRNGERGRQRRSVSEQPQLG